MNDVAKFWDRSAERYAKSPIKDQDGYRKKLKISQRYLAADAQLLEFACGTGTTAMVFAPLVKRVVATDISPKMLEIANSKATAAGIDNIDFQCVAIEDVDEAEQSFDMVLAHSILHLLEDPESAINKAYALLKPGGVFVSTTACLGGGFSFWRFLLPIARLFRVVPFVKVLSKQEVEAHLVSAGFNIDYHEKDLKIPAAFIVAKKPC